MQKSFLKSILLTLAGIALAALVFGAGFFAGRWSAREVTTASPLSHGATGTIAEIQDRSLALKLRNGTTRVITTDDATRVERDLKKANWADLRVGDRIIVVGAPDPQGNLKARVIRTIDLRAPTRTPKTQ